MIAGLSDVRLIMIGRIFIFLFVFSVSAFADVAAVGNQTASLVNSHILFCGGN